MKKILLALLIGLYSLSMNAYDWEYVSFSGGAEAIANYSWRGFAQGGLSLQPWLEFSAYGVAIGTWANVGMDGYEKPIGFYPEIDVYLSYTCPGEWATLMFTHYYYFRGTKYFNFAYDKNFAEDWQAQDEIELTIRPLQFLEENNDLEIGAAVMIGGGDYLSGNKEEIEKDVNTFQKLYSTYIYFKYTAELGNWVLKPEIGFSPHRSLYTWKDPNSNTYKNFALNNISFTANYNLISNDIITFYFLAGVRFNLFDVGCEKFEYGKNFGWNIGLGFEL